MDRLLYPRKSLEQCHRSERGRAVVLVIYYLTLKVYCVFTCLFSEFSSNIFVKKHKYICVYTTKTYTLEKELKPLFLAVVLQPVKI